MPDTALSDTQFYITGEAPQVTAALADFFSARGADVRRISRLDELVIRDDVENVLVAHYSGTPGLAARLPSLKKEDSALRVILLHEITERGQIDSAVLSVTDHLLEKPFTRQTLEKALSQLRFHPLANRPVYLRETEQNGVAGNVLKSLGASVITELPADASGKLPELALFAPDAIDDTFRSAIAAFRRVYADVPAFMIYDPQAAGILDSGILKEIAYMVQRPVSRQTLRQKLLTYFEQPQKERRKNPRKQGISQMWISAFNLELGTPELFESPYLIDISQSGLSFQTYINYPEGQLMAIWIVSEDYPDKIIDLRGHIRWKKKDNAGEPGNMLKYGVEFTRQESEAYRTFAQMIAMH